MDGADLVGMFASPSANRWLAQVPDAMATSFSTLRPRSLRARLVWSIAAAGAVANDGLMRSLRAKAKLRQRGRAIEAAIARMTRDRPCTSGNPCSGRSVLNQNPYVHF